MRLSLQREEWRRAAESARLSGARLRPLAACACFRRRPSRLPKVSWDYHDDGAPPDETRQAITLTKKSPPGNRTLPPVAGRKPAMRRKRASFRRSRSQAVLLVELLLRQLDEFPADPLSQTIGREADQPPPLVAVE